MGGCGSSQPPATTTPQLRLSVKGPVAQLQQDDFSRERAGSSVSNDVRIGDPVVVWIPSSKVDGGWFAGVVRDFSKGFTSFTVHMDDGSIIEASRDRVKKPEKKLRSALKKKRDSSSGDSISHSASFRNDYEVGQRVSCKISGWSRPYEGVVTKKHDNSYTVKFDDGETIDGVAPAEMKKIKNVEQKNLVIPGWLDVGARVEAKVPGWRRYYAGVVEFVDMRTGQCKILFDDGELATALPSQMRKETKKKLERKASDSALKIKHKFKKNERVIANPHGRFKRRYPGIVTRDNEDGTYAVQMNDGDFFNRVGADEIESVEARLHGNTPPSTPSTPSMHVGQLIEAKIEGWRAWYQGTIKKIHSDGSLMVLFDDGEVVPAVDLTHVRPSRLQTGGEVLLATSTSKDARVLGRLPDWGAFYLGRVESVDGQRVGVLFDDGERYEHVPEVKLVASKPGRYYNVGDRVSARILDWSQPYKGVCVEVVEGGCVLRVEFDDGESHLLLCDECTMVED